MHNGRWLESHGAVLTRKHGHPWFSRTLVIGDPQENGEQPEDFNIFSVLFWFSRPRILENYPRRPSAFFWTGLELWGPTFDRFRSTSPFFFSYLVAKCMNIQLFLIFPKEQALKPCSDCRSRDSAQIRPIESSPNPNLTDLVKKQGPDFLWLLPCRR